MVSLAKPKSVSLSRALGLLVEYRRFSGWRKNKGDDGQRRSKGHRPPHDTTHTLTSLWAMLTACRNWMASPMLFMMSDASIKNPKHSGLVSSSRGQLGQTLSTVVPLSVKAWSPLSWIRLKSSPPSMLQTNITNAQNPWEDVERPSASTT